MSAITILILACAFGVTAIIGTLLFKPHTNHPLSPFQQSLTITIITYLLFFLITRAPQLIPDIPMLNSPYFIAHLTSVILCLAVLFKNMPLHSPHALRVTLYTTLFSFTGIAFYGSILALILTAFPFLLSGGAYFYSLIPLSSLFHGLLTLTLTAGINAILLFFTYRFFARHHTFVLK